MQVNLVAVVGSGFGDYLAWTPAIRAYKQANPDARIVLWTCNTSAAREVFATNPDVAEIVLLGKGDEPPENPVLIDSRNAQEWGTRWAFMALGMDPLAHSRKVIYSPTNGEREEAISRLLALGIDGSRKIVGLQARGGWSTKRWPHWHKLGACLPSDWDVLLLGRELPTAFEGDSEKSERTIPLVGTGTFRQTAALLPLLDAYVGFDSGLTFAAVAQKVPTVALFGPHDPAGLVGDCEPINFIAIREAYPGNCMSPGLYDLVGSCRTSDRYGQKCPMMTSSGGHGPPCMRVIDPGVVALKILSLPDWEGKPLDQRR